MDKPGEAGNLGMRLTQPLRFEDIPSPLYITFEDGKVFQIHHATITLGVNQQLCSAQGFVKCLGGIDSNGAPFDVSANNYAKLIVEEGRPVYHLTFKNNLNDPGMALRFSQPFFVGDIKFWLTNTTRADGVWEATGHLFKMT